MALRTKFPKYGNPTIPRQCFLYLSLESLAELSKNIITARQSVFLKGRVPNTHNFRLQL
jgi:hypothetical protein